MKALRTLGFAVLLASGVLGTIRFATPPDAFAQGMAPSGGGGGGFTGSYSSYTATTGTGNNAFVAADGAKVCLNGSSCTAFLASVSGQSRVGITVASANVLDANGSSGLVRMPFDLQVDRSITLGNGGTAKGTCDVNARGKVFFVRSAAAAKDTFEVCAKDAADAYAWRTLY